MNSGIASLVGAAAPGIAQGVGQAVDSYKDYKKDQALDTSTAAQTGSSTGIADAAHPVWGILNNLTGNPGNAPLPGGGAPTGGPALPDPSAGLNAAMPAMPAAGVPAGGMAPQQLQNGGVVRANYGKPTIAPSFERGPALPVGPNNTVVGTPSPRMGMLGMENGGAVPGAMPTAGSTGMGQGVTPATTEGQILTMDAGGVVPQGYVQQPGITGVPMNGRGAALVEGVQAGQNIGRNIYQAWHEHQSQEASGQAAMHAISPDANVPDDGSDHPQGFLGKAKDAVEGFFHHLNEGSLDDDGKQRAPGPGSPSAPPIPAPGAAPAGGAPGAAPAPAASPIPSVPGVPAPGGAAPGAAGAPGQPPPGIAAPGPAAGPAPAASPIPSGGPSQPAQPQAGQPQPVSPEQKSLTQDATKAVAASPQVKAGIPDKSPAESGQPHSLTPEWYRKNNELMQQAVYHAAKAGEDPAKVYESLTAMRNAHFQGQILKELGTANVAFQNGDMDSVKKALSNVNYYLPNGQDITFKTADAAAAAADPTGAMKPGDLMYKNPFFGMYGHEHDPEYTKIDSQHIQSLGAAALDPRTVQEAQLKSYSAQNEVQSNRIKAQGEADTGLGRKFTGLAAIQNAGSKEAMLDVDARLKRADAGLKDAQARWYDQRGPGGNNGMPKITVASLTAIQKQALDFTNQIAQGQPTTTAPMVPQMGDDGRPQMGPDGKPVMIPNMSPGAGKQMPDPNRIPVWMKNPDGSGFSPEQQHNVAVLGGQIASANVGLPGMNVARAVELGARITQQETKPSQHTDPKTGKPMKDFVYDPKNGTAHIWMGNAYENVYLRPNVADESGTGGPGEPPSAAGPTPGEAEGGSAGPDAFQ